MWRKSRGAKRDVLLQREQLLPQLQVKQTTSANLSPTSTRRGVQCILPSIRERQYALRGERDVFGAHQVRPRCATMPSTHTKY